MGITHRITILLMFSVVVSDQGKGSPELSEQKLKKIQIIINISCVALVERPQV